eukprot:TRINITY_DN98070_c0_g1_i1.p1 TRINITY_DN98070_c0_g1~~TRINITY_DN98070_c0_g1_i1.p1  ORF type:complete len:283 (-),score=36.14 TRINITY_DN98070_c0_g1_i1:172-1020(-)
MGGVLASSGSENNETLEEIQQGCPEWFQIDEFLQYRSRNYHERYKIAMTLKRLWRIRDNETWRELARSAKAQYGSSTRLFHGTTPENARRIISSGFQLPAHPGMFGKGVYFAKCPLKSVQYARVHAQTWLSWTQKLISAFSAADEWPMGESPVMLVCDVYLGRSQTWRKAAPHLQSAEDLRPGCCTRIFCPRRKYQSVYAPGPSRRCTGRRSSLCCCFCNVCCHAVQVSEWIVYDPCQGIPRYVLEFETSFGITGNAASYRSRPREVGAPALEDMEPLEGQV